ncbi:WD40-repeat-containing domain protein [Gorgonomyces haynaldii]|nr:WD40-repeat-containing domain protein [Gorgonomyces haynaldii]
MSVQTDGQFIICGNLEGKMTVFDQYGCILDMQAHQRCICQIKIEDRVYTCSWDGSVKIWSYPEQMDLLCTLSLENNSPVLCFDVQENKIIAGTSDGDVWIAVDDQITSVFRVGAPTLLIGCVVLHPDYYFVSAGEEIVVYDHQEQELVRLLKHTGLVTSILVHQDLLITSAEDMQIHCWKMNKWNEPLKILTGHTEGVRCLSAYKDRLVSGSYDASLRIWSLDDFQCKMILNAHQEEVNCVTLSKYMIVSCSDDEMTKVFDFYPQTMDQQCSKKLLRMMDKQTYVGQALRVLKETREYLTSKAIWIRIEQRSMMKHRTPDPERTLAGMLWQYSKGKDAVFILRKGDPDTFQIHPKHLSAVIFHSPL